MEYNTFAEQVQDQINASQREYDEQKLEMAKNSEEDYIGTRSRDRHVQTQKMRDDQVTKLVAEAKEAYDVQRYDQAEAVLQQALNIDPRSLILWRLTCSRCRISSSGRIGRRCTCGVQRK